ncbi:MAG: GAF domain-containing protein [Chloroflexi bacterium]|nr:GAF domain-containing protein [Chloroflexota bacterium]
MTLFLRNALTAGLGVVFGLIAATVTSFVAILVLQPREFNWASSIGVGAGAVILLYDIYAPPYRQPPAEQVSRGLLVIAIIVSVIFIVTVLRQRRRLLLTTKLTLAFLLTVLVPIIVLRAIGARTLHSVLTTYQNNTLLGGATLVTNTLDDFIQSNLDSLRVDGQSPVFADYLEPISRLENYDLEVQAKALDALRSLKHRDPIFIESYSLLDRWGNNVLDTSFNVADQNEYRSDYFRQPFKTGLPYVSNVEYVPSSGEMYLYFSAPVRTTDGEIVGVIRARYNAYILQKIVTGYNGLVGETSFAAILDETYVSSADEEKSDAIYIFLAHGKDSGLVLRSVTPLSATVLSKLQMNYRMPIGSPDQLVANLPGLDAGLHNIGNEDEPVFTALSHLERDANAGAEEEPDMIAAARMKTRPWVVIISQDQSVFTGPLKKQERTITFISVLIAVAASLAAVGSGRLLTNPVLRLTATAEQISAGDLDAQATVESEDEIGTLARAFNSMTAQLRELIDSLEERVAERTRALERRAVQLQTAAEVGSAVAALRDLDELLSQVAHLISDRFGFYHVGIFLLDERGEYAVLRAANSLGGQHMLARHHQLKVGEVGIVGYATGQGEARIALDVGQDAIFFDNPDLPETRSEVALPLSVGGKVVGALDIQSKQEAAFSEDDIATLQVLADQIAVAIENARLFAENQRALESVQRAYGEVTREAWQSLLQTSARRSFVSAARGAILEASDEQWKPELIRAVQSNRTVKDDDGYTLSVPVVVRGQAIGAIRMCKPENADPWREDEISLAETLVAQLGTALDSARLYNDARRRADRERMVSNITTKIRSSNDPQTMLQVAMDELRNALGASRIQIMPHATAPAKKEKSSGKPTDKTTAAD